MKRFCSLFAILASALSAFAAAPGYSVDGKGILRDSDGKEAAFFGINYTMPFAHAYRAADYAGFDRRGAIDRDVYHFARLGLNAYRIHIWDVEISDSEGNLLENDHLDLLDYLIYKLDERGIKTLVTAQTNFGNGYPERNRETGGFSYLYDKCRVHADPAAVVAQKRYIAQLVSHVNPYTGNAYKDEPCIVAFEVNNEPCHSDTPAQTEEYINSMLGAIAATGNTKPVFYNVSHNMDHVGAYYNTAVGGTTYQWYPIGLVAGHTRSGNFLPYVDSYKIPFSDAPDFGSKAKAVYEFDAADIMYSYMYPAMARTFRSAGFQWMTQFAYDPIDMAAWNTEYQTHYLNLAYTPSKAISLMIAAEAAYSISLHTEFPQYPADTVFNAFRISYAEDLSEMNTPRKFYYSNNTATVPVDKNRLEQVAGYGSSPVVAYEGAGAYFLDRMAEGVWRLEIMPDAITIADPFAKPSLQRQVVAIKWNEWPMTVSIPELGGDFAVKGLNDGNNYTGTASGGVFNVRPGVYVLSSKKNKIKADTPFRNMTAGEFVAPAENINGFHVVHTPQPFAEAGQTLKINARIAGPSQPDSVVIYPGSISFWSDSNPAFRMRRVSGYDYAGEIPGREVREGSPGYTITVYRAGDAVTFPAGGGGAPLDWDFTGNRYYTIRVVDAGAPVELLNAAQARHTAEVYAAAQEGWAWIARPEAAPGERPMLDFRSGGHGERYYIREDIKDIVASRAGRTARTGHLCISFGKAAGISSVKAGFVTSHGFTYMGELSSWENGVVKLPLAGLSQGPTALLPLPYPTFLETEFTPSVRIPFDIAEAETLQLTVETAGGEASLEVHAVWLE